MVIIRSPQYWQSKKPPYGSKINWNHPLSHGLQGCFLFNEPCGPASYNLVSVDLGKRVYNRPYILPSNITRGYDFKGSCLIAPTTNTIITHDGTIKLYHGKSPSTFYCGVRSNYSPWVNWNTIWAGSTAEMGYGIMVGGKPFVYNGGGTDWNECYASLTSYKYHQIGYIGVTGAGTTHYIDGVVDRNVYTTIVDYPIYGFCGTTQNFEVLRGSLYFAYFWGGSTIPLKEVNKNPYQFITPSKNRKIFLSLPPRLLDAGQLNAVTADVAYPTDLPVNAANLSDQINSLSFVTETGEYLPSLNSDSTGEFETFPEGEAFPALMQIDLAPRPIITVVTSTIWELATSITATSSTDSALTAVMALLGSISGTASVGVQVNSLQLLASAIAGTSTADATVLSATTHQLISAITGTGSVDSALKLLNELQSAITGLSAAAPTLSAINFVTSAVAGSASITSSLPLIHLLLADIGGTASISLVATAYGNLSGGISGTCNVVPSLKIDASLICSTAGTCTLSGTLNATQLLTAAINAGATIEIILVGANDLGTAITGTSNAGITLKLDSSLLASILGTGAITAEVALYQALIAAIDGLSATDLTELEAHGARLIAAIIGGTSNVTGTLKIDAALASIVKGSSRLSALIKQLISLETSITGLSDLNIITRFVLLKALIEGTSNLDLRRFLTYIIPANDFKFLKANNHHQLYK